MSENSTMPAEPASPEDVQIEEYEALLTTLATSVRNMMARTKTTKTKLAKKIGKDLDWLNKFLDGFNEDICVDDIQAIANAMGYKADIQLNERNPGDGPAYEIRDDGFKTVRSEVIPEPPEDED